MIIEQKAVNEYMKQRGWTMHDRSIPYLEVKKMLTEFAEQQVKLFNAPAVSKCVEPVEEGTLIDFFSWLKLKGYLRSNLYAKNIIDLYKSINGC